MEVLPHSHAEPKPALLTKAGRAAETTSRHRGHIPALDGIRGVAVLAVLLFHYGGGNRSANALVRFVAHVFKAGWAGVTLFFVLSGFLITGILWDSFGRPHWTRNFYARRALRILPLYFLSLAIVLAGAAWAGTLHPALARIWIFALFLQNMPHLSALASEIPSPFMVFHLWSIAVEEQFYLLWPFLLVLSNTRRSAVRLCLAVFVLSFLFRVVIWTTLPNPLDLWQFLLTRAGELSLGGALAILYRGTRWPVVQRWAVPAALASLAAFILSSILAGTADLTNRTQLLLGLPAITVFCTALIALALRPGTIQRLMSAAWLRRIGALSYGIYIFHVLLGNIFRAIAEALCHSRGETAVLAAQFVLVTAGSIAAAWLSFRLFEQPILRLKDRFSTAPAT